MRQNVFRAATAAMAMVFASTVTFAATIDDFSDGTPIEPSNMAIISSGNLATPTPIYNQGGLSGVVGGVREIQLVRTNANTVGDIIGRRDDTLDRMEFLTTSNEDMADFILNYDGTNDGSFGPGALTADLTTGGTNSFGFQFSSGTSAGVTVVDVFVRDTDGDTDTESFNINGPTNYTLLYSTFSGLINFASISRVQITINGIADGDYNLDLFETAITQIPEPATAGLLALGLGLFAGRRRR